MAAMLRGILKKALALSLSVRTTLWLLGAQLLLLLYGAFAMPAREEFGGINSVALLAWLRQFPLGVTWWLWASIGVLGLLALNTLACGAEAIIKKRPGRHWLWVISPQIIHLGFLFMLLGHLVSSVSSASASLEVREGARIELKGGVVVGVEGIELTLSPAGYPTDMGADVVFYQEGLRKKAARLSPNRPAFFGGLGVYIKNASMRPEPLALFEIHKELGTPWALAGGALFTLGTILLVGHKIAREK